MVPVKKPPESDARKPDPDPACAASRMRRAFVALLIATALLYTLGLAGIDLWAPDEPRYAAIAEELRSGRHGWTGAALLHLNGEPYSQKPPLYFWLAAAFGWPFGRVGELAARLPSALAGVGSVAGVYWIGRLLRYPPPSAWLSAALLATSFRFAFTARRAQLDVLLTGFELAAIALFLLIETRRGGIEAARGQPAMLFGLHASLGAAALVKGPVGWLPLLVFAAYLAWEGRLAAYRKLFPAWSGLLSVGPLALWIGAAIALAPEGFAREAVGTNVFARFFAGSSHARPFYYYAYQLPLDFLPWSLLWPMAIAALVRSASTSTTRFLGAWILVPLAFFSLSAGKRGLYLLPIFPALALLSAFAVFPPRGASTPPGATHGNPARARVLTAAVAVVALLELSGALFGLPRLDPEKSPRPIARAIASHARAGEAVGLYGLRPLEGALPHYGDLRVRSLRDESAARRFLDGGGRLILLRARDFERLRGPLELASIEVFRSGRRALVLAQRAADSPSPRSEPESAHVNPPAGSVSTVTSPRGGSTAVDPAGPIDRDRRLPGEGRGEG